jgi:hypothetical protein
MPALTKDNTHGTASERLKPRRCWHTPGMATQSSGTRSALATIVGYVLVAVVVIVLFNFIIGTIFWLIRTIVIIAVVVGLLLLYLHLKSPD